MAHGVQYKIKAQLIKMTSPDQVSGCGKSPDGETVTASFPPSPVDSRRLSPPSEFEAGIQPSATVAFYRLSPHQSRSRRRVQHFRLLLKQRHEFTRLRKAVIFDVGRPTHLEYIRDLTRLETGRMARPTSNPS